VGRDLKPYGLKNTEGCVSIHAPAWGATFRKFAPRRLYRRVSIHAPAWGATKPEKTKTEERAKFQSTRPRGARHIFLGSLLKITLVSIHAPAWGATSDINASIDLSPVSIHAPAWGATNILCPIGAFYEHVSIHAPAWGATSA